MWRCEPTPKRCKGYLQSKKTALNLLVITGEPKWQVDVKVVLAVRSVPTGHNSQRTPHTVDHEHDNLKKHEPYHAPLHRHASDRLIYGDRNNGTRKDIAHYRMGRRAWGLS